MGNPRKLFLVTYGDQTLWQTRYLAGKVPDRYHYGVNYLPDCGFDIVFPQYTPPSAPSVLHKLFDASLGRLLKRVESYFGILIGETLAQLRFLENCQFVLAFFENFGLFLGFLKRIGVSSLKGRKIIVVACWLAYQLETKGIIYKSFARFAIAGVERVLVYSRNQIDLIAASLKIDAAKIVFVPFGIDLQFYQSQRHVEAPENFVLSVGGDSGRDYQTLIAAAERLPDLDFVIICRSGNLQGFPERLPTNVKICLDVDHVELRRFYQTCKFGAIITHVCPYPSGSTVLQEMNAMGKTCIISRTAALADFVDHGKNALWVESGSVQQVVQALVLLWNNDELRRRMETEALKMAHEKFGSCSAMAFLAKEVLLKV